MHQLHRVGRRLLPAGALVVLVAQLVLTVSAGDIYGSYLIKSRQISDLSEGLEIMSQFTSPRVSTEVKCKKYALVLSGYYKDQSMDQFKLAKLAQDQNVDMNAFRRITMDLLRDLYITAIEQLLEEHLGEPCMELIGCLGDIFYNRDAKARAYLNRKQLKRIMDQYSGIANQSINFLLDNEMRHPSLAWSELERPVQLAAVRLFMGDEARARAHFGGPPQAAEDTSRGAQVADEDGSKQVVEERRQVQVKEREKEKDELPREQVMPAPQDANSAHLLARELMSHDFYADSERLTKQLPDDYRKLLGQLNDWLHLLHHSLPLGARLSDRCRAYARLLSAEPSQLGLPLVEQIFQETEQSISSPAESSKPAQQTHADTRYLPDANMRENFLFTISVYPRNGVGDGLWMSLIDCVSLWREEDEHVRQFMTNSRQFLYSQLDPFIKQAGPEAAAANQAPASPASPAPPPRAAAIQ